MADISLAIQAKSDQLNAVDILGVEPVITIRDVKVFPTAARQKIWVYFHGDNNRPWKPSTGMGRILGAGWGYESDLWIGKSVKLFVEPSVIYAGEEVGGIRIRAMSHIPERGLDALLTLSKSKRIQFHVDHLNMQRPTYPQDKFNENLPEMIARLTTEDETKRMSLEQIVAYCQRTGDLTPEQLAALEQALPVNADDEEEV